MDNIKNHNRKIIKAIDKILGHGKGCELLEEFNKSTVKETPNEISKWVRALSKHLEKNIEGKNLIEIREECACFKANKNSPFAVKHFPEIRKKYPDNNDYLNAVAEFLTKRVDVVKELKQ